MTVEKFYQVSCDVCEDAFTSSAANLAGVKLELKVYQWAERPWPADYAWPARAKMNVCRECQKKGEP